MPLKKYNIRPQLDNYLFLKNNTNTQGRTQKDVMGGGPF